MKVRNSILLAALFAMAIIPAHAAFKVNIGGTVITDQGAGDTSVHPVLGIGVIQYTLGGIDFTVSSGTGTTDNPFGTLTLEHNGTASSFPASIELMITDTGYTVPAGPGILSLALTSNTPANGPSGTLTAQGFYTAGIAEFDTSGPSTTVATITSPFPGVATATSGVINFATPFSLTQVINIDLTAVGSAIGTAGSKIQVTANLTSSPVPEPGAIVLLGTALLGTVVFTRRKLNRA